MCGIFYLPVEYISLDTGLAPKKISAALECLRQVHFAYYDSDERYVFVVEMAAWQVAKTLNVKDNRRVGIIKELTTIRHQEFRQLFYERYAEPYSLDAPAFPTFGNQRVPKGMTQSVLLRDGQKCKQCGGENDLTIDHIIARINGGLTVIENLRVLCRGCNSRKAVQDRKKFWEEHYDSATPEGLARGFVGVDGGPQGPHDPHDPAPGPDPVPVSGSEGGPGETVPVDEPKKYGEFGQAELTDVQYGKLEDTLGSENLKAYIRRFDRWKEQNKTVKKYRNRTAYLTIQDWWERDLAEGKTKSRASPSLFVANDPNPKGENSGDPNLRAAKDFIDRRLAKTVCASVPDVRQDA